MAITQPLKQWNNTICSNMDGPGDYYTKSDKEIYDTTYMWNLKKKKKMVQWTYF